MMFGELGPGEVREPDTPGNLFQDVNKLRKGSPEDEEENAEAAERAKYNDTVFALIAISKKFELLTLSFILVNAGFIGYDADYSARFLKPDGLYSKDTPMQFPIFENIFCVYFTVEVIIRFLAFKHKHHVFCDGWFVFDGILVTMMVVETWILPVIGASGPLAQLSILRLLRLARITRMAKLMRFFPELQIIVKGLAASVRSVAVTASLLILLLYVFAILFTTEYHQGNALDIDLDGDSDPAYLFGSISKSMQSLFIMGTILDDITYCSNIIRGSGKTAMLFAFILFVLISSFTILNMLIGILCEVVSATGEGEREKNLHMKVRGAIGSLFEKMDQNKNGEISQEEFMSMRQNPRVVDALNELDIQEKHFDMYAQLLFKPSEPGGPIPTFDLQKTISMIMRLQPGTTVSALDFASFQMAVFKNHENMKQRISHVERMCAKIHAQDAKTQSTAMPYSPPGTVTPISSPPAMSSPGMANSIEKRDGLDPIAKYDRVSSQDILAEIQRRLGVVAANPQPEVVESWSRETFTC